MGSANARPEYGKKMSDWRSTENPQTCIRYCKCKRLLISILTQLLLAEQYVYDDGYFNAIHELHRPTFIMRTIVEHKRLNLRRGRSQRHGASWHLVNRF